MKTTKKLLCLLLTVTLTLTLCSCGLFAARVAHKGMSETIEDQLEQNLNALQSINALSTLTTQHEVALKRGNEVGNVCYNAQLPIITAAGVQEATLDPTAFGKVTVIHFWATWSPPAVAEMPYFDNIAKKYSGNVQVVAVHGMLSENAPAYIAQNYPDSPIVFLKDTGENEYEYHYLLGGNGTYPRTVILDARGIITRIFEGAVTESQLEIAVLEAMGRM